MYASIRSSKSDTSENFTRQGSLRRVIPSADTKENILARQNEERDKLYKTYRQEYVILAEYKMIQSENIQGVYVIPSKENPFMWFGVIFVRSGPYEDGVFRFTIILDDDFPEGDRPKVVFQCDMFHPVVQADNCELHLMDAFPVWSKNEQHLWQVLKYIQWIFYNVEASIAHGINKEAFEMFKNNQEAFNAKAKEIVKSSLEHLYDDPPTEDKHYILFQRFDAPMHDRIKATMLNYHEEEHKGARGHSWVLPGSCKPLGRTPSPHSESES